MNNLHLSAEAQNDLMEIKAYIEEDLLNPSAALTTVSRITKSLRVLQNYAYAGALLSSIADRERLQIYCKWELYQLLSRLWQ